MQLAESSQAVVRISFSKSWRLGKLRHALRTIAVTSVLFAAVVSLQWRAGAFTAEFSGYPDEASHYMSGLLVHDYVAAGLPTGPMKFAQNFYLHYPYLAIGHWPPLFYAVEGAWMLLFSPSRVSVMLLMALITTALATTAYEALRVEFGQLPALTSALVLVFVPLVQKYGAMVMLDTLLAVLSFWAVLCFGRFLETGHWRDAAKFGALASLAILTKGNGFDLALVPPIAVLLTRRFYLLRRRAFWVPALMVMLVCLPWHLFTMHLMLPTFVDSAGMEFTGRSLRFYSLLLAKSVGPAILGLMLVGFFARIVKPFRETRVDAKWAALAAFVLSIGIFYCTVPAGIEARWLIAAMPPLFMFFVAGAAYLSQRLTVVPVKPAWRLEFLILLAVLVFAKTSFAIPEKASYGFRNAVQNLISTPEFINSLSLVSSETNSGEGLLVSEVAMLGRREEHAILRASKVLADSDWNMKQYRAQYSSAQILMNCLEQTRIRFLILDMSPGHGRYEHHQQLLEIVKNRSDHWKLAGVFGGGVAGQGPVSVYRSTELYDGTPQHIPLENIVTNMNGVFGHWPVSVKLACKPDSSSTGIIQQSTAVSAR